MRKGFGLKKNKNVDLIVEDLQVIEDVLLEKQDRTYYVAEFILNDLDDGFLLVQHKLGSTIVNVAINDDDNQVCVPDEIEIIDEDELKIDLTSYGDIVGIWKVGIVP